MTNNKKTNRPTVIDGVPIPPGMRPKNVTMTLVRDPKTGKGEFKITNVHAPVTVVAGRTTINHVGDGPYSRQETEEINKARFREGLPVLETRQHFSWTVNADLGEQPSEFAKSLNADKNDPAATARAAKARKMTEQMERDAERPKSTTVVVGVDMPGPKMDRS